MFLIFNSYYILVSVTYNTAISTIHVSTHHLGSFYVV